MNKLLEVENLCVSLGDRKLLQGVSFTLSSGSSLGILGESGSGKSLACKAVMGLLPDSFRVSGRISFMGRDLQGMGKAERGRLRGKEMGFIMQNPMTAFDPLYSIGEQMCETFTQHLETTAGGAWNKSLEILTAMQFREPERIMRQYPHELSGGMIQRVMIGLTVALGPSLIIADEPTTALDVITQAEILDVFLDVKDRLHGALLFVTHDLGVIAKVTREILIMYQGRQVEHGDAARVLQNPSSGHARYLIESRLAVMRRFHKQLGGVSACSF